MLIKNVHILPIGEVEEIKNGYILIGDGKIIAIGSMDNPPKWQEEIDGDGAFALPGLIDSHTHLGISASDAYESTLTVAPHLRAMDSVNPSDTNWQETINNGITSVAISPSGSSVIAGQISLYNTFTRSPIRPNIGVKCALGDQPKSQLVSSRMAEVGMLRETLAHASRHAKKIGGFDIHLDPLKAVINKKLPLFVHVHKAGDIISAIRIAEEFNIKMVLVHATEGTDEHIAKKLAELNIGVIAGPQIAAQEGETSNHSPSLPALLTKNKVQTSISTHHPKLPVSSLMISAALAVREGLSPLDALKSITINAANNLGVSDLVGSLEIDKRADVVLFDRFPLEFYAKPKLVISQGKVVKSELIAV